MPQAHIAYDDRTLSEWIGAEEKDAYRANVALAEEMLQKGTGQGNDFTGWLDLPKRVSGDEITAVNDKAAELRDKSQLLICIGIGGSYLGARATIDFLSASFEDLRSPRVVFAGHQLNSDYLDDLRKLFDKNDVVVNVISKSGTTTEPGVIFRIVRQWMESRYGKQEAAARIVATTDPQKGALRKLATEESYATFSIPGDVGGRFSVLTPVGLFPIAYAGIDIAQLVAGAADAMSLCGGSDLETNLSARYAVNRNILFRRGKTIEMMASLQPQLHYVAEWWKQLYGESEGKNLTGIFPAAADYTTDLHSLGQWMQEGLRNVFETFVVLKNVATSWTVPEFDSDDDGLNYLKKQSLEYVNDNAYKGTLLAHLDGDVPASTLTLDTRSPETLGQLFYFYEKAVALSGYLLRVNPFNQPGVEAYKRNMFALLSKPGFEEQGAVLQQRLRGIGL
ncbi:MAG: glucose-6-phosphate isomerase [Chitinivibrionales bacterium]|nr:glucose-6-phosphate isomerase [Chitinivibrionales bacterium]